VLCGARNAGNASIMIVVTGVGRSGTSLVALIYRELGFDPGGEWYPEWRAGLEDSRVVELNSQIIRLLGIGIPIRDAPDWIRNARLPLSSAMKSFVRSRFEVWPEILARRPAVRWERFQQTVDRFRGELVAEATARQVVKDPRFCWTLPVWAAAGAPVDHVLICLRNVDAMIRSRIRIGHLEPGSWSATKNAFILAAGMCLTAVNDYNLDYDVVRFPRFLEATRELHEVMRFPEYVSWERFTEAFNRVADHTRVHE
jgi:hypothetical protein